MRGIAAAVNYRFLAAFAIIAGIGGLVLVAPSAVYAQSAGSTVGATVCAASSSIAFTVPVNDSVVSNSSVVLSGTVDQASQVDVYIDDVFDHVIPLTIGQTMFNGTVQLTSGTHTIKVVAVSVCPGADGSASTVVTYTPPPTPPSTGGETPTEVQNGNQSSDETIGAQDEVEAPSPSLFPEVPGLSFTEVLDWMNINVSDSVEGTRLSPWRAVVVGVGVYLVVLGMAAGVIQLFASLPAVTALLPQASPSLRNRWVSWGFRIVGLLVLLGALFL